MQSKKVFLILPKAHSLIVLYFITENENKIFKKFRIQNLLKSNNSNGSLVVSKGS